MPKKKLKLSTIEIPIPKKGNKIKDLSGMVFGRLTVIGLASVDEKSRSRWLCECVCGEKTNSLGSGLKDGTAQSCGCLASEKRTKHGDANWWNGKVAPEYICLRNIIQRCTNPGSISYPRYGGIGVSVCDEWNSLEKYAAFLSHVGRRPSKNHSIDRFPNRSGNYEPGNVRWATRREQSENRKTSVFMEYKGEIKCVVGMARKYGIPYGTLLSRVNKGWSSERAISTPIRAWGISQLKP